MRYGIAYKLGQVTFYSRSKQRLWTKGESSGHFLKLQSLAADCDLDSLLALALPDGPTCHVGTETCWHDESANSPGLSFLTDLEAVIASRQHADPKSSYTASLFARGVKRIAQKVGEEGVESALAAMAGDRDGAEKRSGRSNLPLTGVAPQSGFSTQ